MAAFYLPHYHTGVTITSGCATPTGIEMHECPNCGYEFSEEPACYYTSNGIDAETPPKPKESRPWVRKSTGRPPKRLEMK